MSSTPIYDETLMEHTIKAIGGSATCQACILEYQGWGGPGCCEVCDSMSTGHTCEVAE